MKALVFMSLFSLLGCQKPADQVYYNTAAAPAPLDIVAIIYPCGPENAGPQPEIFLRLGDGTIIASFSANESGLDTHFTVLSPGSYETSDGSHCFFEVDSNNQITNAHR